MEYNMSVINTYHQIMDLRDPRSDGWFLMSSIWPTLALSSVYYLIVLKLGPWFMSNRAAFNLRTVLLIYNLMQIFINTFLVYKAGHLWLWHYDWTCQPVDYTNSALGLEALDVTYWYYISKFVDFLDSFFFVLRKKWSHLTVLHVVHHGGLPIFVWFGPRFVGGGHTTFCGCLNAFIHVLMYTYYFLAAFGPKMQKFLWWKKYLTKLQMLQFTVFGLHSLPMLFVECDYPKVYSYIIIGHGLLYFILFANFYLKAYIPKPKKIE
jgi:elongation of very long chain fatty acids protein 7